MNKETIVSSAFIVQSSVVRSLRPCMGQGASLGEETVLADSGRAGEVAAGVGRVRTVAFLSILHGVLPLSQMCGPVKFWRTPWFFHSLLGTIQFNGSSSLSSFGRLYSTISCWGESRRLSALARRRIPCSLRILRDDGGL